MPQDPLVSICIPTYKRSRYLASLLESLTGQLAALPYPYEIVIADNASPDPTREVVMSFTDRLPIRYLRHATNIGGYPNWQFVMTQAAGRYLVYLSDDDSLLGDEVADVVAAMEADPEIVVTYAPWLQYDLVAQKEEGLFWSVPRDVRVARDRHAELLDHVLRHHIFPEIAIVRRDAFVATMPRIHEPAFLAFVHSSDYLAKGAVLIRAQPFYVAITRYFADEQREQLGAEEAEHAWDRYRGGLEYMLARSGTPVAAEERTGFMLRVQRLVASRMSVAVRLRRAKRRDPVDTYYIAMRIRGMGYESMLPAPMSALASEAMIGFLLNDPELRRGMARMLCVGRMTEDERDYLATNGGLPVDCIPRLASCRELRDTLVFVRHDAPDADGIDESGNPSRNVRVLRERDLGFKFGA